MRLFRAGDRVRFGTFEGVLSYTKYDHGDDFISLEPHPGNKFHFDLDGTCRSIRPFGPVLTLIEAAPEKPYRREWWCCRSEHHSLEVFHRRVVGAPHPPGWLVREVLPDDLPPMTKAEAREWLKAGITNWGGPPTDIDLEDFRELCGHLGIAEVKP